MVSQAALVEAVEKLVDENDLSAVLQALELMCYEKAEHMQCNWQDAAGAKQWERMGGKINICVRACS